MRWPYVVIAFWVALAIALPLSVPTLKEMSERHPVAILPADAPANVAPKEMAEAFKQSGSENVVVVLNFSDTPQVVDVPFPLRGRWTDQLAGFAGGPGWQIDVAGDTAPVLIESHFGRILHRFNSAP